MPLSPAEIAAKWATRTTAASPDYVRGVNAVAAAPGQAAAAKADKMRLGLMEALDSGKWQNRVASVSLQAWKDATIAKGQQRLGQGVQAATNKVAAFHQEFQPFLLAIVQQAKQMDDTTLEGRIAKANFVMRETSKFHRSGR